MYLFQIAPSVRQCWWGGPFMGMGWGVLLWPAMLILIGIGFYYTFIPRRSLSVRREDDALEIARSRFARGEITAEEFEEINKRIRD